MRALAGGSFFSYAMGTPMRRTLSGHAAALPSPAASAPVVYKFLPRSLDLILALTGFDSDAEMRECRPNVSSITGSSDPPLEIAERNAGTKQTTLRPDAISFPAISFFEMGYTFGPVA